MEKLKALFALAIIATTSTESALAQDSTSYARAQGGEITLPSGEISFVDRIVVFEEGSPHAIPEAARQPNYLLGPPEITELNRVGAIILGCRGSITAEFTDNALIDVEGADIHIWEVGEAIEPMTLAISQDGMNWIEIGLVSGSTASVDISEQAEPGATYRFIRLTDVECLGPDSATPGADVDAVAAVGSAARFVFDGDILFEFDESFLTSEAKSVLRGFAGAHANKQVARIIVQGHTDDVGSTLYNTGLSLKRAESVRDFFVSATDLDSSIIEVHGVGETEPVATNDTEDGRQSNRRVEVILVPK